jgi:hypothetical protein
MQSKDAIHTSHWLSNDSVFLKSISSIDSASLPSHSNIDFFRGHALLPVDKKAIVVNHSSPDWLFIVVIVLLGIVAYIRTFFSKNLRGIISACLSPHLSNQLFRDENLVIHRTLLFLQINFALTASLLLYLFSAYYGWTFNINETFLRYLLITLAVATAIILKFTILRICGWIFKQENEMAIYRFNISLINGLLGLAMIPFAALILFAHSISFEVVSGIIIILVAIAYIYRIFRGFAVGLASSSYSPLYLFLYLCALEIAPLLIFIKLIQLQA